jgi:hypothetical protein
METTTASVLLRIRIRTTYRKIPRVASMLSIDDGRGDRCDVNRCSPSRPTDSVH